MGSFGEVEQAIVAIFEFIKTRDILSGLIACREVLDVVIEQVKKDGNKYEA